jgi:hypothetical protein
MNTPRNFAFASLIAVLAAGQSSVAAQQYNPETAEAFLVPVAVWSAPGAYGTLWGTELWYRNNSVHPVDIYGLSQSDHTPTIGLTERLNVGPYSGDAPGTFLILTKLGSENVQFDLRLFNRADSADKDGTKLPVVRATEFADQIHLINVPTRFDVRSTLRVYVHPNDRDIAGETVTVSAYSNNELLLASAEVPLRGLPKYGAILSLIDIFPQVAQVERVRMHVQSHNQARIWAFVSVVSNLSQRVSVVTPD